MKLKQVYLCCLLLCLFISWQMLFVNKFVKAESLQYSYSNTIFKPPKDGSPDDTTGAGSRETGSCSEDAIEEGIPGFRALMPKDIQISEERPFFSVYIPSIKAGFS
ncbi:MAG TPA: hypothetical protein V6D28_10285 [Leptolyngbyaceae cyanobacterium]